MKHQIEFVPNGRGKARNPPDPHYPKGVDVDLTLGKSPSCLVKLPYPAPECGHFLIRCSLCDFSVVLTAAGRVDDPVQVEMPCELAGMTPQGQA
jgi:hypothetical protein